MKSDLELTKEALVDEFTKADYNVDNPLGNAGAYRKIQEYLIACVDAESDDMWDWFETNIVDQFNVSGVDQFMLEFAQGVLVRYKSKSNC